MKKITDYLHLYGLGLSVEYNCKRYKISQIREDYARLEYKTKNNTYSWVVAEYDKIRPILRPLSDMDINEETEMKSLMGRQTDGVHPVETLVHTSYSFAYLLSKHFDIFGLINDGLAIDKTTLK